jgi:hypothetical protein
MARAMDKIAKLNPPTVLIEQAKQERERMLGQIEQNQRTIERSREIIARINEVLSAVRKT